MTDQPKRGKRVQIYLPADLLEQWEATPRYERSAAVAKALRLLWSDKVSSSNVAPSAAAQQVTEGEYSDD